MRTDRTTARPVDHLPAPGQVPAAGADPVASAGVSRGRAARRALAGLAGVLALGPAAAVAAPTAVPPAARATTTAATVTTVTRATAAAVPADLDDFHTLPAYRAWYAQTPAWAASTCPAAAVQEADGTAMECARIEAPRDWYHADRGTITLMISRTVRPAGAPAPTRLLLTNPGGPGGSGLSFGPLAGRALQADVTHEVVGMDPRGVGGSTRAICLPPDLPDTSFYADGDARTVTRASFLADASYRAAANADCARRIPGLLPYLTSDQTARDLNLVRAVLGYDRADYYGVSYGTWLGSVLARSFPSRVDRVVLDGNMDWASGSMQRAFGYQPAAFQGSYDRAYLPFLARHADVYRLGTSPRAVDATVARVRAAAARGTFGPMISPDALDGVLAVTQYTQRLWGRTGSALRALDAATRGDRSGLPGVEDYLIQLFDPADDSSTVQLAVTCNDTAWSQDRTAWYDANSRTARHLPLVGASYLGMSCAGWTQPPALSAALLARPVRGVLMLDTEGDPATAYAGAWATHVRTPGTRSLVVDDGAGHGAALAYECARVAAADYLERGSYPAADAVCQAGPYATGAGATRVADTRSYELFAPLTAARPAPSVAYTHRDLRTPAPDGRPTIVRRLPAGARTAAAPAPAPAPAGAGVDGRAADQARALVERAERLTTLAGLAAR